MCSATMDVKVAVVFVCLCALAITPAEGGIPKCCIKIRPKIPKAFVVQAESWYVQQANGACDISALVLHVRGIRKPVCASLRLKPILESPNWRQRLNKLKASL